MQVATALAIDTMIKNMVSEGNYDVYEPRLNTSPKFMVVPYVIYFYYIRFEADGKPVIKHYTIIENAPIPVAQIGLKIQDIARKIRNNSDPNLISDGSDFQGIVWKHKSYIVFFMDSEYWTALNRVNGNSAVVCNTSKKDSKPNHSFFDTNKVEVDMVTPPDPREKRTAVYLINHMKKSDFGDDIGYDQDGNEVEEKEKFSFDVYFDVRNGPAGPSTVFVIDPDGTNMGPPQSPP